MSINSQYIASVFENMGKSANVALNSISLKKYTHLHFSYKTRGLTKYKETIVGLRNDEVFIEKHS